MGGEHLFLLDDGVDVEIVEQQEVRVRFGLFVQRLGEGDADQLV